MKIGIISICKNEQDMIIPWIEHFLALDQIHYMCIVDTGSTDETIDYIKSYDDKRINLVHCNMSGGFAEARNFGMAQSSSEIEKCDFVAFFDIDEIFSDGYQDLFEMLEDRDLTDYDIVRFPFVKFWDFDKLWFHVPPTLPSIEGTDIKFGMFKDTTSMFRTDVIKEFKGELHEYMNIPKGLQHTIGSLRRSNTCTVHDMQNDVFVGHYSKAKLHAQARRTGKSFNYCVGKKRMEFRRVQPVTYWNGKTYDADWCKNATEQDIEELGATQLKQFIDIEGHTFLDYDAYDLNNEYIRSYYDQNLFQNNS